MHHWPSHALTDLLSIELPIIQAPMAGAGGAELAAAVSAAGGLGSLPCAMLSAAQIRTEVAAIRAQTGRPLNLNFFCHTPPTPEPAREARWKQELARYYEELAVAVDTPVDSPQRRPFDAEMCALVEELQPAVVSFHFGLPAPALMQRLCAAGVRVLASATSVAEARWLAQRGCDAIIAQGWEAGGHRGCFLGEDMNTQPATIALVPQIVDAVDLPVIAAGGIGDARGIAAAFALGAAGVQLGTAYLRCPEARIAALHRSALAAAGDESTALTNLFSGRPARGIVNRLMREHGPLSDAVPAFPLAGAALAPLRAKAEAAGRADFQPLWAGQAVALARELPAGELTRQLAADTAALLSRLASG